MATESVACHRTCRCPTLSAPSLATPASHNFCFPKSGMSAEKDLRTLQKPPEVMVRRLAGLTKFTPVRSGDEPDKRPSASLTGVICTLVNGAGVAVTGLGKEELARPPKRPKFALLHPPWVSSPHARSFRCNCDSDQRDRPIPLGKGRPYPETPKILGYQAPQFHAARRHYTLLDLHLGPNMVFK